VTCCFLLLIIFLFSATAACWKPAVGGSTDGIAVAAVLLAHAATDRRADGKANESSQAYKRWRESQVRWRGRHGFSAAIGDGKLRIDMWWD